MALAERTKVCKTCGESKPLSEFPIVTRKGKSNYCIYCTDCRRAYNRVYRRKHEERNPERYKQYRKTRYDKVRNDPKAWQKVLEDNRIWYRLRQEKAGKMSSHIKPTEDTTQQRLDAKPFKKWLEGKLREGYNYKELAEMSDVPDTRLRMIVNQRQLGVTAEVVDKVMTALGSHILLIYPEFYD